MPPQWLLETFLKVNYTGFEVKLRGRVYLARVRP